jgi:hypothetical protein
MPREPATDGVVEHGTVSDDIDADAVALTQTRVARRPGRP